MIPGSHRRGEGFSESLESGARTSADTWGIEGPDVPAVALETVPGDIVAFQHNIKHAAFGGSARRRMFTITTSVNFQDDQIHLLKKNIEGFARFWVDRVYGEKMIATANERRMRHLRQVMANDGQMAAMTRKAREEMEEPSLG